MPALGERFRAAREARGLTLSDVSEQIRIRSVYLAAIEEENWSTIGAPVYVRGFLKTYARFIGLDPEEMVGVFNGSDASAAVLAEYPADDQDGSVGSSGSRSLAPFIWIAALVAVALITFVVYNELTMQKPATVAVAPSGSPSPLASGSALPSMQPSGQVAVGDSASPSPLGSPGSGAPGASPSPGASASEPPVAAGAGGPGSIQLVLSAPSWLRVTVDGNVSMEGTFPAGTAKLFRGKVVRLRIGNAGGVDVYVDGKSAGKLGAAGVVAERSFTL